MSKTVLVPGLRFIQKYIHRNPYTNSACFDEADAEGSREYRALLREVWEAGYEAGFADGDGESYVESQTQNPYA